MPRRNCNAPGALSCCDSCTKTDPSERRACCATWPTSSKCSTLTNGPKTGTYQVLADPRDWRCGFISRADTADFLVKQITDDTYLGKTPVLTN